MVVCSNPGKTFFSFFSIFYRDALNYIEFQVYTTVTVTFSCIRKETYPIEWRSFYRDTATMLCGRAIIENVYTFCVEGK